MSVYINNFRQLSGELEERAVSKLHGFKTILEVGYYAGQISVRLAEVCDKLTCIDLPNKFFSPDLQDHIRKNSYSNVEHAIVDDPIQFTKDNFEKFDAIFIDECHNEIDSLVRYINKNTKKDITVVYHSLEDDDIKVEKCKKVEEKKEEPKTSTSSSTTSTTTKRTNRQSKTTS